MEEKSIKKNYLFSFTKLNKYFIFPFLSPIFCFLANLFLGLIRQDKGIKSIEFLFSITVSSTYTFGGLLYFISWIRTKTEQTRENAIMYRERSFSSIKYIYNDGSKKNKVKIFLILLIMSILVSISTVSSFMIHDKHVLEQRMYFLFFISLFSKIILKLNIFSHQILSLFIAFLGLILLLIPIFLVFEKDDIIPNLRVFLTSIGFSFFLVLCKFLTHNFYISPYLCILFVGIISTMIIFIGFVIYSLIKFHNFKYIIDAFDFSDIEKKGVILGFFIASFLFASMLQILAILVIYYFSPTLFIVTDIISPLLSWIVVCIQNGEKRINIVFNILGYFIVFFSSLIYNKIIFMVLTKIQKSV